MVLADGRTWFSGEKSVTLVNGLAVALLIMAGLVLVFG